MNKIKSNKDKFSLKSKNQTQKFWYGNPQIELVEGSLLVKEYLIGKAYISSNLVYISDRELEKMNYFIWNYNIKNNLIDTAMICCVLPNKVSIIEFLNLIELHLSYVLEVRVLKASFPSEYFIYIEFKNIEYANVFFNTYIFKKISSLEDEYLMFFAVKEVDLIRNYDNELSEEIDVIDSKSISNSDDEMRENEDNYEGKNEEDKANLGFSIKIKYNCISKDSNNSDSKELKNTHNDNLKRSNNYDLKDEYNKDKNNDKMEDNKDIDKETNNDLRISYKNQSNISYKDINFIEIDEENANPLANSQANTQAFNNVVSVNNKEKYMHNIKIQSNFIFTYFESLVNELHLDSRKDSKAVNNNHYKTCKNCFHLYRDIQKNPYNSDSEYPDFNNEDNSNLLNNNKKNSNTTNKMEIPDLDIIAINNQINNRKLSHYQNNVNNINNMISLDFNEKPNNYNSNSNIKDVNDTEKSQLVNNVSIKSNIFPNKENQINENVFNTNDCEYCENLTCSICLELMTTKINLLPNKVNGIVYGLCGHRFHIECLIKTDAGVCPLCRYSLSPKCVSTCKYCLVENDLWVCLICGLIHCGENKDSNNHRLDHFLATKHQYCKLISKQETFDFVLNCSLESYYNDKLNENANNNNDLEYNASEKVSYLLSEYNSIISSQLESQRFYFIQEMKKTENKYIEEYMKLIEESSLLDQQEKDLVTKIEISEIKKQKESEILNSINKEYQELLKVKNIEEKKYNDVLETRNKITYKRDINLSQIKNEMNDVNSDIQMLKESINEVKMNINLKSKLKKQSGGNILGVLGNSKKGNK